MAADSVTTAGHTAHPGTLKATTTMTFAAPPTRLASRAPALRAARNFPTGTT
jgi:hypothetical protein